MGHWERQCEHIIYDNKFPLTSNQALGCNSVYSKQNNEFVYVKGKGNWWIYGWRLFFFSFIMWALLGVGRIYWFITFSTIEESQ